jgi:hypothetical protein
MDYNKEKDMMTTFDNEKKRSMRGNIKPFSNHMHAVTDNQGKNALLSYLKRNKIGFRNVSNDNRHGIDVLTLNNNDEVVMAWEVEVRNGAWKNDYNFPFRTINCIERKEYMWRKDEEFTNKIPYKVADNCSVYYVQMNKNCKRAVILDSKTILEYPLVRSFNKYAEQHNIVEYVRQVPSKEAVHVIL